MITKLSIRARRFIRHGLLVAGAVILLPGSGGDTVQAQYASGFYYHNPRSGLTYSQSAAYGRGYYYGGFSYSNSRRAYGSYQSYNWNRGSGRAGHVYYSPHHSPYIYRGRR